MWTDPCKEVREQYEAELKRKEEDRIVLERLQRRASKKRRQTIEEIA